MRRTEREVKNEDRILEILDHCRVCRIAFTDEEGLYIVPMNYGYRLEEGKLTLYFHGAKDGRRARHLLKGAFSAAFELDWEQGLTGAGENPCAYSCRYASVIGTGTVSVIHAPEQKKEALSRLMICQTGKSFPFSDQMAETVLIFQLEADQFSAKSND